MKKQKILLAYSGGLDTTYCAIYLNKVLNLEVHAVSINTGGFSESDINLLIDKAMQVNTASFTCIDVREDFYQDCIKYLIFGNILKNGNYPLSVSSERVIQAITLAKYAKKHGFTKIAHGSTGAGNDQVRFDMLFGQLIPDVEILTPIRDQKLSREEEVAFLQKHGINIDFQKAQYSINKGLWGTSVGGKETLKSSSFLPESAWPTPISKTTKEDISLTFKNGELVAINGTSYTPVKAIETLQEIAQPFGIARDIHVGDTIIGIKGRVGFEAAAPTIIIKAHHLLEKHVLTKWQLFWKEQLASWYGNNLHEGLMLDPVMRNIEALFTCSQKHVSGTVFITLYPYRFVLNGIESPHDLMSDQFGTYGEMNAAWTGNDVKGFTKIAGNQTQIYHLINEA